ncbi:kelch domain-containing protein 3 isoform X2 [Panthera pardus]|uniref:rRNA biogenesis protein RRP36 n=1 Tax=Panthera pardus TaxID=9691 RepID=A0A9W2VRF9_PANPR|nr:kelch domain-containing protein 3 isoform X2 [Panthera leo]XP_042842333.1 kelch domain-containing protein 3 isoform X2 [Panthera tigris]XP_049479603.1 kelch domain-containing protein 3-like [Panthera uncia]XP_049480388.1 kelch domain-containing protein 3 isoform X2 [Panthera uncia]XP_053760973.1 kelch domain-containing protein 3 isoform X2 [Panthera pardus]XP_058589994.1 kelch domain-containing protein 3 isoform X2 [Neofelis nebulosa]
MLRWTVHLEGGPRRVNHAAVAVGHRVYSFGGYCSGEDYETLRQIDVHIFNAVSLRWTKLPPVRPAIRGQAPVVPYMRYGHSTVLIDDMVFLWGGRNDTEGACNVLYAFDVNTHKWSTPRVSGTVPGARDGHSACVLGKTMYIFGGYEQLADCFSNDIHKLDTSTMTWTLICTKGNPARWRDFHSATMLGSHMYVFGGRADRFGPFHSNNEIYCNRIRVFDTRTEAWLDCPPTPVLPEGRRSHSAFGYNGELYIFGGYNARLNRHFHDLWKFNPVSFTWKKIEPKGKGPCPRRRQCCCIVGDKIVLFGGTSPSPEEGLGDEFDLIDHSDLHILDFNTSDMSFEELLELQHKVGTKTYKQLVAGNNTKKPSSRPPVQNACVADKHRPLEMSAKVRVPFLRQVVPISKKVARDPRFDDLSGEYNPEVFDKTYQFLNDIRAKEKELVKKQLKKHRSGQEHEKLQQLLQRMEQQELAQQERKRQQELRLALKQERRARAQQGHRPYFLKKSEQRQLVLAEKFKELKRSKKLESFLSRKRRRNAGKDRRHLPLNKE